MKCRRVAISGMYVFLLLVCLASNSQAQWTQFRGPSGNGISKHDHPVEWSEEKSVRWKVKVPGVAWSQPIVSGDQVYVTTAIADGQQAPRTGEAGPGFSFFSTKGLAALSGGSAPDIPCRWKLVCLKLSDGSNLWEKEVFQGKPAVPIHRSNSYASDSPVCDGKRIFVQVPMIGIYCFDLDGKRLWEQPLEAGKMQYGWGTGSSLVVHESQLFLQYDNEEQSYLAAYDAATGELQWKVMRDEPSNWSTPYIWTNTKRTELVLCGGKKVESYELSGRSLWELPAAGRSATTAVASKELIIVGSVTRSRGSSGALTAVKAGAKGKLISDSEHIAWSIPKAAPELASPLLVNGYVFTLKQRGGILSCYDAKTGETLFRERLPEAGGFTASPWFASGKVFCLDETGRTFVLEPGASLKVVNVNQLDGMFWSSAAVAKDVLLLRSADHLYCIAK